VLGIRPDLTVFGKVMAGGLPGGAVGGRAQLMDVLTVPDPSATAGPFVYHPGTFNANPLTAAAGIATLELVTDGTAQARAAAFAASLESAWATALREAGVPGRVWRLSSIIHCALDDPGADTQLSGALRDEGIDVLHNSCFCSTAHGDAELEWSDAGFRGALRSVLALRS
jgi:glutamate-1-semialdehyde aminotransferase